MKMRVVMGVAMVLLMGACVPRMVEKMPYYKLPVIQGMPFDAEAVLSLKTGMSREQVQLLLGAPMLQPSFRNDRWDYIYQIARGGKTTEQHSLNIYFQDNTVSRIEGDALDYVKKMKGSK